MLRFEGHSSTELNGEGRLASLEAGRQGNLGAQNPLWVALSSTACT